MSSIKIMQQIGELLRTQDNRLTAEPIFVVQQRVRTWGLEAGWADSFAWVYDGEAIDESFAEELERAFRHGASAPSGYRRVGYIDRWETVTHCLTEKGAEAYIRRNAYNLREPRIYVESGYRNEEIIALRAFLKSLPPVADEASKEAP